MYKVRDFNVGDKIYRHKNSAWRYYGEICKVTDQCYGIRTKLIIGMLMIEKGLFENSGYIGKPYGYK